MTATTIPAPSTANANATTLETYEATAAVWKAKSRKTAPTELVTAFTARLGPGKCVLEIGSGAGDTATLLESAGLKVQRSDAARAFVVMLKEDGHDAKLLNVLTGPLGEGWDGVFANAVFQHLERKDLRPTVEQCFQALAPGGTVGFSLTGGQGEVWSSVKVDAPRFFCLWTVDEVREAVQGLGTAQVWSTGEGDSECVYALVTRE